MSSISSKKLGVLIKASVIILAVCGLILCLFAIPSLGDAFVKENPELSSWFWPWQIFVWVLALPCYAILFLIWRFSGAGAGENVFTMKAAGWVRTGSRLLFADAVLLLAGNIVLLLLNMNHPGMLLLCTAADMVIVIAVLFGLLISRYIAKAAVLQEESEGTL